MVTHILKIDKYNFKKEKEKCHKVSRPPDKRERKGEREKGMEKNTQKLQNESI